MWKDPRIVICCALHEVLKTTTGVFTGGWVPIVISWARLSWLERSRNHQGYGPVGLWTKGSDPFSRAMAGVDLPTQGQLRHHYRCPASMGGA